jgi:hypothetical protein
VIRSFQINGQRRKLGGTAAAPAGRLVRSGCGTLAGHSAQWIGGPRKGRKEEVNGIMEQMKEEKSTGRREIILKKKKRTSFLHPTSSCATWKMNEADDFFLAFPRVCLFIGPGSRCSPIWRLWRPFSPPPFTTSIIPDLPINF